MALTRTRLRRLGVAVIHGDATVREVLSQANAATARAVVAATSNDLANLEIALLVRDLNPSQNVVLRLGDPHLAHSLREGAIRLSPHCYNTVEEVRRALQVIAP